MAFNETLVLDRVPMWQLEDAEYDCGEPFQIELEVNNSVEMVEEREMVRVFGLTDSSF